MTRAQLKKTLTVAKKQCVPKIGVSEDKIANIEKGEFIEDPKVMCFVTCVYKTFQVIKDGRLDRDMISKQVNALYPNDMKEPVTRAIDQCFDLQYKYSDVCEAVFYAAKCMYEKDPPNFVFP
ncbi:hypothetical protein ACJJTC_009471 [Scirpophaga incertulas]